MHTQLGFQLVSNSNKDKVTTLSLVVLGVFIAGVPFLHILALAWKAGFGLNRTTLVSVLSVIALVGVLVLWLKGGATAASSESESGSPRVDQLNFRGRVKWQYKQDFLYKLLGLLAIIVAVLLVIGYVEYIEPLVK